MMNLTARPMTVTTTLPTCWPSTTNSLAWRHGDNYSRAGSPRGPWHQRCTRADLSGFVEAITPFQMLMTLPSKQCGWVAFSRVFLPPGVSESGLLPALLCISTFATKLRECVHRRTASPDSRETTGAGVLFTGFHWSTGR